MQIMSTDVFYRLRLHLAERLVGFVEGEKYMRYKNIFNVAIIGGTCFSIF